MLLGRSPKVEFICGKCGQYNAGRFNDRIYDRAGGHIKKKFYYGE